MAPSFDLDDTAADTISRIGGVWVTADGRTFPVISGGDRTNDESDDEPAAETETAEPTRLDEILAVLADEDQRSALDAQALTAMEAELLALFDQARADHAADEGTRIVSAIEQVRIDLAAAQEAEERADAEFDELASRIGLDGDGESSDDSDGGESTDDDEPSPAEVEVEAAPEPIMASAPAPAPVRQPARLPARRPSLPAQPRRQTGVEIRANATLLDGATRLSVSPRTSRQIMEAMIEAHRGMAGVRHGARVKVPVARVTWDYPEDRQVHSSRSAAQNSEILDRHLGFQALQASGGLCGPVNVDYSVVQVATDERPVRDALARFNADRGGIRYQTSPTLADIDVSGAGAAVGTWDVDTDAEPGEDVKTSQHVTCGEELVSEVQAIYRQLCFGNFQYRYATEMSAAWLELVLAAHARLAEEILLAGIAAGSTTVTRTSTLGAAREILGTLSVAEVRFRHRHRIPRSVSLVWLYPEWLLNMVRDDIANSLAHEVNAMDVADAQIEAWFRSRNVVPRSFIDGENVAQEMSGAQAAGELLDYPATAVHYLYNEGAWWFLDGGQLDLGITRDNDSNATNDFCMFAETFEGLARRGVESLRIVSNLCPNGASAGTVEPTDCPTS